MTIRIRRAGSLGTARADGITLRCHFAFADDRDDEHCHEGRLRAVNVGTLPAYGRYRIGPEADVDILTWVHSGTISVQASGFPAETVGCGGYVVNRAGTGCASLAWSSGEEAASFVQFWFLPDVEGVSPAQETHDSFGVRESQGFRIVASGFPEDDPEDDVDVPAGDEPLTLTARARLLYARLPAGEGAAYQTTRGRDLYMLVVSGQARIGDEILNAGDAAAYDDETDLVVMADVETCVFLVDVAD